MKKFNILDVTETYIYKLLCLGHKMVHYCFSLPLYLQNVYKYKRNLNLRNKNNFNVPFHRMKVTKNRLDYRIPLAWNKLPPDIQNISKFKSFI